jgi:hypothetical protein
MNIALVNAMIAIFNQPTAQNL